MSALAENSFFQAIRKSLETISTILSPFILISVLSDFKEAIDFVSRASYSGVKGVTILKRS
jgi:hypothetical protein